MPERSCRRAAVLSLVCTSLKFTPNPSSFQNKVGRVGNCAHVGLCSSLGRTCAPEIRVVWMFRVRGGSTRRAPNGVCHSWEHGCALGVARDAVCPSSSEAFSSFFFSFFSFPFVYWWLVGLARSESRGTERTDRRRITRSTFSIQEVGSETAILEGKRCDQGDFRRGSASINKCTY